VPPAGFVGFCLDHEGECDGAPAGSAVVDLTSAHWRELEGVQTAVNTAVKPREEPVNQWDYPSDGYGDCNRYALEKRRELEARGWPREALLLAVVVTERREGHLVLIARTSGGDLVLDNRMPQVVDWTRLPYRWVSRQSAQDLAQWVSIDASRG
jgi:predicted transglutaminase-like cysteine proteinase